jgi:hypothetical protein
MPTKKSSRVRRLERVVYLCPVGERECVEVSDRRPKEVVEVDLKRGRWKFSGKDNEFGHIGSHTLRIGHCYWVQTAHTGREGVVFGVYYRTAAGIRQLIADMRQAEKWDRVSSD